MSFWNKNRLRQSTGEIPNLDKSQGNSIINKHRGLIKALAPNPSGVHSLPSSAVLYTMFRVTLSILLASGETSLDKSDFPFQRQPPRHFLWCFGQMIVIGR